MRKTIATLGIVGLGLMTTAVSANATTPDNEKKITICHATSSATNPFVSVTINLKALNGHTGAQHTHLDIVPVNDGDIMPQGQNLTDANLAILASGCATVGVDPVVPPVDTPVVPPVDPVVPPVDPVVPPVDTPVVPPVDTPVVPPVDTPVDTPAVPAGGETPGDDTPGGETPGDDTPGGETPGDDTSGGDEEPASAAPASAATVVAPKAAAAAAKKTNVGYNVQTAVGQTEDTGLPVWLMALTGVLTAGAATVVWRGTRRTRSAEN